MICLHGHQAVSGGMSQGSSLFMGQALEEWPLYSTRLHYHALRIHYFVGMGSGNKLVRENPLGSSPDLAKFNNEVYQGQEVHVSGACSSYPYSRVYMY